jgi:hypothetical protein
MAMSSLTYIYSRLFCEIIPPLILKKNFTEKPGLNVTLLLAM